MTLEQAVEYALEPPDARRTRLEEAPPAHPAGLSAREVEVLKLVAQGHDRLPNRRGTLH